MPGARKVILDEIRERGPLTFARYMEIALYGPGVGYYATGSSRIGTRGDYFTAASMGPAFGMVIARQIEEMWRLTGCPDPFVVVEQGAGDGWLARDVLDSLSGELAAVLEYRIIEPLPNLAARQREMLAGQSGKVAWIDGIDDLEPFVGVHLSNELIDAFPFHLLQARGGEGWCELMVGERDGSLVFLPADLSSEVVGADLPPRPDGNLAEWRPMVGSWLRALAGKILRGYILTFDYGMTRPQMLDPARTRGTFACYRGHRRDEDPLADPGEKDITAHVDFTGLEEAARAAGFTPLGFCPQNVYVVKAGESLLRECEGKPDHPIWRGLRGLVHPGLLGNSFHAIALAKDAPTALSGFRTL